MTLKRKTILTTLLLSLLIFGNGCFLQPVERIVLKCNFIEYGAVFRLAEPVTAQILIRDPDDETKWVRGGELEIPTGTWCIGNKPEGLDVKELIEGD